MSSKNKSTPPTTAKKTAPAPAPAAEPAPEKIPEPAAAPAAESSAPTSAPDVSAPTKRGRGRPRKDGGASAPVSPSEAAAGAASKAGRKPKMKPAKMDGFALGRQIQGIHQLAAMATNIPEFAINETEAALLGEAVANVCEEYDLSLSGKTGAFLQLLAAAAMVYGPRVETIGRRVKDKKAQQSARAEALRVVAGTDVHGAETPHA